MFFRDVIGQEEVKRKLLLEVRENRVPHAQLFSGPEGTGKLPMAIAYARYLLCQNKQEQDACGECPSCRMFSGWSHPDLHFVFPIINKAKPGRKSVCDDFLPTWRTFLSGNPYFNINHWLDEMGADNQQATIYTAESDEIFRKLTLKSSQGGYKIMIIWLPEKMQEECSNKLLKLLEEPPAGTLFLLVSEQPERLLATIRSRTQETHFSRIASQTIAQELHTRIQLPETDALHIAHWANGSWLKALESIHINQNSALFFDMFVLLMRLAYQRKVREMKQWSEQVAGWGREKQKNFLEYSQRLVRENFMYNFNDANLIYMNEEEKNFSSRFARFINERNVIGIMDELTEAQRHIEQNVNARMVFFDFALKMIVLLIQ